MKKQAKPIEHAVQVRLHPPLTTQLENWRKAQAIIPHRSDALRELLRRALAAEKQSTA